MKDGVEALHAGVSAMSAGCRDMQARLAASKSVTAALMRETTEVQGAARRLEQRQVVAESWRERLGLTREEREVVVQRPGHLAKVDQRFFEVLEKVGRVRGSARVVVAAGHLVAGEATLEDMARVEEAGVQRLYRWGLTPRQ